ncbi:MAG: hypothetical protein H7840_12260 [Alphaproteobacteria bacterium]
MRNSQYFGLICVLAAIAAGVISHGILRGIFVLASVGSIGLAAYFLVRETGLLDDDVERERLPPEPPPVRRPARGRSAFSASSAPSASLDAAIIASATSDSGTEPEPPAPPPADQPESVPVPVPIGSAGDQPIRVTSAARSRRRRSSITVESPLSWLLRTIGRGK